MSDFCCRAFPLLDAPDPAELYGALCSIIPPPYACGQGFSNDRLRFSLEGGARAELRFSAGRCEVWLSRCPAGRQADYTRVYGPLFESLVRRLAGEGKEAAPDA